MNDRLDELVHRAQAVGRDVLAPNAEGVDRDGEWPAGSLAALAGAGLMGLTAPQRLGGHGQGLLGVVNVTEALGRHCASTAMCFGMHCVATAVMAAKATPFLDERYLAPIAQGRHISTLALSETGTGTQFFLPQTSLRREGDGFVVHGEKQFVTNGGHADSYVISTLASVDDVEAGEFSCLVVDKGTDAVRWGPAWNGFGMRGNSSRSMTLDSARLSAQHLLGAEGDQVWYVFEVVAPFFLAAMAGTYVGIAQAALELTLQHLRARRFSHSGQSLADIEVLQHRVGQIWTAVEKTRLLVCHAAQLGDSASPEALTAILASKADAGNTAVLVCNEAMTLCGGMAYRENGVLARLLRDARASHVMSPTTDLLTTWTGRSALGLPLF